MEVCVGWRENCYSNLYILRCVFGLPNFPGLWRYAWDKGSRVGDVRAGRRGGYPFPWLQHPWVPRFAAQGWRRCGTPARGSLLVTRHRPGPNTGSNTGPIHRKFVFISKQQVSFTACTEHNILEHAYDIALPVSCLNILKKYRNMIFVKSNELSLMLEKQHSCQPHTYTHTHTHIYILFP